MQAIMQKEELRLFFFVGIPLCFSVIISAGIASDHPEA